MIKSVNSAHYHIWTDALYARQLARSARNAWDRGSHVRWCVGSAWTAFEMAVEDALATTGIGYSFKQKFDEASDALGLQPVDWGQGLWQQVLAVHVRRVDYIHGRVLQTDLFPSVTDADDAIAVLRAAIKTTYTLARKPEPDWPDDDSVAEEPSIGGFGGSVAHLTRRDNVEANDPNRIRTAYVNVHQIVSRR